MTCVGIRLDNCALAYVEQLCINPYKAEIFFDEPWKPKFFYSIQKPTDVLACSFRLI